MYRLRCFYIDVVIQTTEGRKNLGYIQVDVIEILRRYAPLNDIYVEITIPRLQSSSER